MFTAHIDDSDKNLDEMYPTADAWFNYGPGKDVSIVSSINTEKTKMDIQAAVISSVEELKSENMTIEDRIKESCEAYGVPFPLALAIARLETGWFTSSAYVNGNNPGGMSINEIPITYPTIEEGVDAFVSNLHRNYISLGLDTPEEIGPKYCPVNPNWVNIVNQLMIDGSVEA